MPRTPLVQSLPSRSSIGTQHMPRMAEKASGWVVTVTIPDPSGPSAKVWYAACTEKVAAMKAVKRAIDDPSATIEISREMSETLMTAFGLKTGQAKCFN